MVPSPGLDLHLDAFPIAGEPRWLITSPELQMKRLLVGGLAKIVQIGKCFRRGELGTLHEPEFTMIEWYRANAGADDVMRDTEELVATLATSLHGKPSVPGSNGMIDVTPPWPRMRVDEAFERHAGVRVDDVLPDEEQFFRLFVDRLQPALGHERPVFLTHWPASMASLARLHADDPRFAERFEAFVAGIELCNGFGELTDAAEQRRRYALDTARREREGMPVYPVDERFLAALDEGMPPSGGNALGFDRLVMLLAGVRDIADVVAISCRRL
jgi:lysyl-tRNA synthetase class 2